MKQVLIIADGILARIFISALLEKYFSNNYYIIVSKDTGITSLNLPSSFKLYVFDPLAEYRLSSIISSDLHDVFIVMEKPDERDEVCSIIRRVNKDIPITLHCESRIHVSEEILNDSNVNTISTNFVAARALISKIPNIPSIARGFGLNKGEIMQINIPFGSAYSYISVGSIQQIGWRIAGIYRKNDFLLAKHSMIIQPNDSLLVVGDPMVLNNIHKKVTSSNGNFPAPFGIDIYVYIDFRTYTKHDIDNIIVDSMWLHRRIKNDKMVINIINPSNIDLLTRIKNINQDGIMVNVDYHMKSISQKIDEDANKKIGLIIVAPNVLKSHSNRRSLYNSNTPILKIGKHLRLHDIENTFVLYSHSPTVLKSISYSVVDFASQLGLSIKLYEFELDEDYNSDFVTYYQSIGRVFNKRIIVERTSNKNPIFWLHKSDDKIIQFIPFEISLLKKRVFWLLHQNVGYLSLNIDKNPQIVMPV